MSYEELQMQFAHSKGHTSLCFTTDGLHFLTCGSEGDARIWKTEDPYDPFSECVGRMALAVAFSGEHFYIGADNHYVQAFTFPDAKRDGIMCRFQAPVTHIATRASWVAAGSSDMVVAIVDKNDPHSLKKMMGHTGPVTGVAIDPLGEYLASSSCDGSVKIWDIKSGKEVKTIEDVFHKCNDFFRALTLGRSSWENETGRFLAIPKGSQVALYLRETWELETCLSDAKLISNISIAEFSPCGKYLAAVSSSGELIIWNVVEKVTVASYIHPQKVALACVAWEPHSKSIAVCDRLGQFALIECKFQPVLPPVEDIVDENEVSLEEIKRSSGWESQVNDDAASSVSDDASSVRSAKDFSNHLQPAFQPSSTPAHLQQRFMVWNAIGTVRSFDVEDDKSIEVEFHDTTFHHQLHLKNYEDFSMSALSHRILILATDSAPGKLSGVFLNAWDGTKEWITNFPDGESITGVAASGNWVAVSTSEQHLRLFNYSGSQREILTLPGQVVCLAGHENLLAVVYHNGLGLPGSQNLGFVIYQISELRVTVIAAPQTLPIGLKTNLKWAGFSDEGRLCTFDSFGILRCLGFDLMNWLVVADTRTQPKAPSDHYFVVGVSERYQNIRCILCKGSYYPMTMPRPILVEIPLKLPLCESDNVRSTLEESFLRLIHFLPSIAATAETHSEYQQEASDMDKTLNTTVVKLFANACKADLHLRAVEIASTMSEQPLQKAYTYASRCGKRLLLDKISEITAVNWSEVNKPGQVLPNGSAEIDHTGFGVASQRDLFEESQAPSIPSGNKILEAENRGYVSLSPVCDNPFKVKDGKDKARRQLGDLQSSRKKVVVLGSGPSFK